MRIIIESYHVVCSIFSYSRTLQIPCFRFNKSVNSESELLRAATPFANNSRETLHLPFTIYRGRKFAENGSTFASTFS